MKLFSGRRWTVSRPAIVCLFVFLNCARPVTAVLTNRLDFLQEGEQLVKKIGGVFAFKVKDGPGGKEATWIVDVKNGKGSVSNDSGMGLRDCGGFTLRSVHPSFLLQSGWNTVICWKVRLFTPTHPLFQQQYVCVPRFMSLLLKSFRKLTLFIFPFSGTFSLFLLPLESIRPSTLSGVQTLEVHHSAFFFFFLQV